MTNDELIKWGEERVLFLFTLKGLIAKIERIDLQCALTCIKRTDENSRARVDAFRRLGIWHDNPSSRMAMLLQDKNFIAFITNI